VHWNQSQKAGRFFKCEIAQREILLTDIICVYNQNYTIHLGIISIINSNLIVLITNGPAINPIYAFPTTI
jgi:hypothetical protein